MFLNVGYGNLIAMEKIQGIVHYDSSKGKTPASQRLFAAYEADPNRTVIDATSGRRARALIICTDNQVWMSAISPEGLQKRSMRAEFTQDDLDELRNSGHPEDDEEDGRVMA